MIMKNTKKAVAGILGTALVVSALSVSAFAATSTNAGLTFDVDSTVGITGTPLSIQVSGVGSDDFASVEFGGTSGAVQTSNATLGEWTVSDTTGTWAGWNVTALATTFTEQNVPSGQTALTLPAGSLTLEGSRSVSAVGATTKAVDETNGPKLVAGISTANVSPKLDNGTAVKIVSAKENFGMGVYKISEPVDGYKLTLPMKDVKIRAGGSTFLSTITYSIISGE